MGSYREMVQERIEDQENPAPGRLVPAPAGFFHEDPIEALLDQAVRAADPKWGQEDVLLTTEDIAQMIKMAPGTVTKLFSRGELPGFKINGYWRTTLKDYRSWIEARRQKEIDPDG